MRLWIALAMFVLAACAIGACVRHVDLEPPDAAIDARLPPDAPLDADPDAPDAPPDAAIDAM